MSITALTIYILMWPAIVAVILAVICTGFVREMRSARRKGEDLI
ncbi:putative transporter small subunit [Janibacter cremeus]|nr:putative transporter small subunit [Janibacter cremeus]WEV77508.1 putative transporter small subunit [Janibacter cremeus]